MWSWKVEASEKTTAPPCKIWTIWSDVKHWPQWDEGLLWAQLKGPFKFGSKGMLKPKKGPKVTFTLIEVQENRSYTDVTKMPFTKILFRHTILPQKDGSFLLSHQAEVKGLFAPLLKGTMRKELQKGMPKAIKMLIQMAENG